MLFCKDPVDFSARNPEVVLVNSVEASGERDEDNLTSVVSSETSVSFKSSTIESSMPSKENAGLSNANDNVLSPKTIATASPNPVKMDLDVVGTTISVLPVRSRCRREYFVFSVRRRRRRTSSFECLGKPKKLK